jgi:hypothetical protein
LLERVVVVLAARTDPWLGLDGDQSGVERGDMVPIGVPGR